MNMYPERPRFRSAAREMGNASFQRLQVSCVKEGILPVVAYQCDSDHEVALELVARLAKDSSFSRDPIRVNQSNYESFYGNAARVLRTGCTRLSRHWFWEVAK